MIKYAVFNVSNRFQTYSNSIDCTITTFDVLLCNFFFLNVACVCKFFLMPFGALQIVFLQIQMGEGGDGKCPQPITLKLFKKNDNEVKFGGERENH